MVVAKERPPNILDERGKRGRKEWGKNWSSPTIETRILHEKSQPESSQLLC